MVLTQSKLSEWGRTEELRKIIVTTFDWLPARLAELDRPVTPLEAAQLVKALYLEGVPGRIVLLDKSADPTAPGRRVAVRSMA